MTDTSNFGSQLGSPPTDGISGLRFSATNDLLLACSWDGVSANLLVHDLLPCDQLAGEAFCLCIQLARLYDARHGTLRGSYSHQAPLLDACFQDNASIFTAGLDSLVKRWVQTDIFRGNWAASSVDTFWLLRLLLHADMTF